MESGKIEISLILGGFSFMELNEAVAGRIKGYLKEREITQFNLFGSSGTACSTISMICRQKVKDVKLSTILNLCRGLNIELKEFFDDETFTLENLSDNDD